MEKRFMYLADYQWLRVYKDGAGKAHVRLSDVSQAALESFRNRFTTFEGWVNKDREYLWAVHQMQPNELEGAVDNDGEGFGYDPYPTEDSPEYLIPFADVDDIPF